MSFFGGGTDMPSFFNENRGAVISTTFDKYCYVNVRYLVPFMPYISELIYNKIERVNNINDIEHPLIRECMRFYDIHSIRLTYEGELPANTGLGASSSFAVGMINAFNTLKNIQTNKIKLSQEAIHIERNILQEAGGWQDQIAASFGGFNRIDFKNNNFKVSPINIDTDRKKLLNNNLMLFYTGVTRFSADIHKNVSYKDNSYLKEMLSIVDEAQNVIENKNIDLNEFGKLLNYSWKLKKFTNDKVSNNYIDEIYNIGIKNGAIGGKLLGAGGGGFILFYIEPNNHQKIINALNNLTYVPFNFENEGSTIIYNKIDTYIPRK